MNLFVQCTFLLTPTHCSTDRNPKHWEVSATLRTLEQESIGTGKLREAGGQNLIPLVSKFSYEPDPELRKENQLCSDSERPSGKGVGAPAPGEIPSEVHALRDLKYPECPKPTYPAKLSKGCWELVLPIHLMGLLVGHSPALQPAETLEPQCGLTRT